MRQKGISLIETLVAVTLFVVIATVAAQSLAVNLRNSRKSEATIEVRENVTYAMSTMERLLRNALDLDCSASQPSNRLNYTDEYGQNVYFLCNTVGTDTFIASNSATLRLTSPNVGFTNCSTVFNCTEGTGSVPDSVVIDLTATHTSFLGAEGSNITSKTKILLRNYHGF